MIAIRPAEPADAAELVRLRRLMFQAMNGADRPGPWEEEAQRLLELQLAARPRTLGAFVVDGDGPYLAACAVGTVEQRLPAPGHPTGRFGFVFNVCTDLRHRGQGYARQTTAALLDWFAGQGVTRVDLHATDEAERLYRSMGFAEHSLALSRDLSKPLG
ncbi:GNAT family N-acetyltransferase [Streptomyces sp. NPDC051940]|uniref:GNAT family N-acetyltransferase n=1 Tax=Streptomyces sp. NPDC051940 TaxID=3155675 RepID=UPI0034415822